MNTNSKTYPIASLFRRLMAMLYDALLLLGISFAYGLIVVLLLRLAGADTLQATSGTVGIVIIMGLWFSCASFYVWCWHRTGQTLGMKSWRLQLQNLSSHQLPTVKQCWLRCIVAPLSMAIIGLGYLWCLFDPQHHCLHDRYSKTKVVLLPK